MVQPLLYDYLSNTVHQAEIIITERIYVGNVPNSKHENEPNTI